jgi:protocatechuate 3,4-dioxygenase beta subunit
LKTRQSLRIFAALFLILFAVVPSRAQEESKAQKKAEAQLKTLHGVVIDRNENPVPSSVVYLKNVKSQAVKTYIADETGTYRFSGLDPNVDYEIHAEHGDMMSATRTISSFDSRRDMELTLKLTHKKPAK